MRLVPMICGLCQHTIVYTNVLPAICRGCIKKKEETDNLRERIARLESAIRKHRDTRGDDRCYLDNRELYSILPEGYNPPEKEVAVTLEQCAVFIATTKDPATVYVSPQRRIEELEKENAELQSRISTLEARLVSVNDNPNL